jgi:hypothetical protein
MQSLFDTVILKFHLILAKRFDYSFHHTFCYEIRLTEREVINWGNQFWRTALWYECHIFPLELDRGFTPNVPNHPGAIAVNHLFTGNRSSARSWWGENSLVFSKFYLGQLQHIALAHK